MKKRVLVFTGTRADYGLLFPLIKLLKDDTEFVVEILATGTHLSEKFGSSLNEIELDGFSVDWKVDLQINNDTDEQIVKSMSLGLVGFLDVLRKSKPDVCIVLGDRYEAFAFAISCQIAKVPLAHIHGGEVTEGALDEAFRHSITKLSYLHFVSSEAYRNRVIQLGESPERVFNTGALGVDNILKTVKISKQELQNKFNIKFKKHNLLITFHPETLSDLSSEAQIKDLVEALDLFKHSVMQDCFFIFTMPNSDPGHEVLFSKIYEYVQRNPENCIALKSMGRVNYLSAMSYCDAVVGNSSSGIIEAPSMNIPTVNIGDRQKGRLRANSIFDCAYNANDIFKALNGAIDFKNSNIEIQSLFGNGRAAEKMKAVLKEVNFNKTIQKSFYDRY